MSLKMVFKIRNWYFACGISVNKAKSVFGSWGGYFFSFSGVPCKWKVFLYEMGTPGWVGMAGSWLIWFITFITFMRVHELVLIVHPRIFCLKEKSNPVLNLEEHYCILVNLIHSYRQLLARIYWWKEFLNINIFLCAWK